MKRYFKYIDGRMVVNFQNDIIIVKNGMQTINPTEEMLLEDGWEVFVPKQPEIKERTLEDALEEKIAEIIAYDSSEIVNRFYVEGKAMWLDKATRVGLSLRFDAELENGMSQTTLWYNDMEFTLYIEQAKKMLRVIEVYASKCYDNTQRHIATLKQLTSIELVDMYNYTTGYPDVLHF